MLGAYVQHEEAQPGDLDQRTAWVGAMAFSAHRPVHCQGDSDEKTKAPHWVECEAL